MPTLYDEARDLVVASLLPTAINSVFANRVGDLQVLPIAGLEGIPSRANILLAFPGACGKERPQGWPFDLRWVHLLSAGLDSYPDWVFEPMTVTHSPGISGDSLAEYALAAIFAAAKRLPELWIRSSDQWNRMSVDMIAGSTLGIVGFGDIGSALARRALALGMTVQALRRSQQSLPEGVRRAPSLEDLLATSDHVVLAAPGTPETEHLINHKSLASAKPGLHLINIARGSLVDNLALLDALNSGRVGRATLDVTDPEPPPPGHPFYAHPKIHLSAHTASNDRLIGERLAAAFADNVARFRAGKNLLNVVDRARGY